MNNLRHIIRTVRPLTRARTKQYWTHHNIPPDPLYGLREQYRACQNPNKLDLTVGCIMKHGTTLQMASVAKAAKQLTVNNDYLNMQGDDQFIQHSREMVFGKELLQTHGNRIASVQTISGTGACSLGGQFLVSNEAPEIHISTPSWVNHRAIFSQAGMNVKQYRYYDSINHRLNFGEMLEDIQSIIAHPPSRTLPVILTHACAHNPSGTDLTRDHWDSLIDMARNKCVMFVDMAYQGLASGSLWDDAEPIRELVKAETPTMVAHTFSKMMGIYGQRTGSLHVYCSDPDEKDNVQSQLQALVRKTYSNPPSYGSQLVNTVLSTPELQEQWVHELREIHCNIMDMREVLQDELTAFDCATDWSHLTHQKGLFWYSGLSKEVAETLRRKFGVFILDSGRVNMAAVNPENITYLAQSIVHSMHCQEIVQT